MGRVAVHAARMDHLLRSPNGPTGRFLWSVGLGVEARAKTLAPVRTGRLRSSIRATQPAQQAGRLTVQVGSDVEYASYQKDDNSYLRNALRG